MHRVALKIYEVAKLSNLKRKAIEQEISCMIELNGSEHFPRLLGTFETEESDVVLVQEYISGNSLLKRLQHKFGPPKEEQAKDWMRQLANAVRLMHSKSVCHRDLKLDNIIISDSGKLKVIDFGFSVKCA